MRVHAQEPDHTGHREMCARAELVTAHVCTPQEWTAHGETVCAHCRSCNECECCRSYPRPHGATKPTRT